MPNHIANTLTIEGEGAHEFLWSLINRSGDVDFNKLVKIPKSLHFCASLEAERLAKLLTGDHLMLRGKDPVARDQFVSEEIGKLKAELGSRFADLLKEAKVCVANIEATGYPSWHEACVNLWGTKWNAYDQDFELESDVPTLKIKRFITKRGTVAFRYPNVAYVERITRKRMKSEKITFVSFRTAWNTPNGIWDKMVSVLPAGLTVTVKYADEDWGSNAGSFSFNSKGLISSNIAPRWSAMNKEERQQWIKFALEVTHGDDANPTDFGLTEDYEYED